MFYDRYGQIISEGCIVKIFASIGGWKSADEDSKRIIVTAYESSSILAICLGEQHYLNNLDYGFEEAILLIPSQGPMWFRKHEIKGCIEVVHANNA